MMDTSPQRSLFESRAERDIGIARVSLSNESWIEKALAILRVMKCCQHEATGEDIRLWLLAHGLEEPTKPHAWGALTRTAVLRGILADTGRVRQMKDKRSHARRTPLWRFV
jgi:hypothetical protein